MLRVIGAGRDADGARLRRAALIALGLDLAGGVLIGLALRLLAAPGIAPGPAELSVFLADAAGASPAPDRAAAPVAAPEPSVSAAPPVASLAAPILAVETAALATAAAAPRSAAASAMAKGPAASQDVPAAGTTATAPADSVKAGNSGMPVDLGSIAADGITESELLARIEALVGQRLSYPPLARQRNIEGVVELGLTVARDGSLEEARLSRSSGSAILDRAARTLVRAVFPIPLSRNLAADLRTTIRIVYQLR